MPFYGHKETIFGSKLRMIGCYPTKTLADDTVVLKLIIEWTKEKRKGSNWNIKGLYAITRVVNGDEYHQIQAYKSFKETWDIL